MTYVRNPKLTRTAGRTSAAAVNSEGKRFEVSREGQTASEGGVDRATLIQRRELYSVAVQKSKRSVGATHGRLRFANGLHPDRLVQLLRVVHHARPSSPAAPAGVPRCPASDRPGPARGRPACPARCCRALVARPRCSAAPSVAMRSTSRRGMPARCHSSSSLWSMTPEMSSVPGIEPDPPVEEVLEHLEESLRRGAIHRVLARLDVEERDLAAALLRSRHVVEPRGIHDRRDTPGRARSRDWKGGDRGIVARAPLPS